MVMANTERVTKALVLLRDGLGPKCEATWRRLYGDDWLQKGQLQALQTREEPLR